MATSQILPFANSNSANVLSPSEYAAQTTALANGFPLNSILSGELLNTVVRQSSFIAAGLAKWLVDNGISVPDDGNVNTLATNIALAIASMANANALYKITHISPDESPYVYQPQKDKIFVYGVGGGGGGGGGAAATYSGAGGGSSLGAFLTECTVVPGINITITTGVGGNGGTVGNDGSDGTATTITGVNGTTLSLTGGKGGKKGGTGGLNYCAGGDSITGPGGAGFGGIFAGHGGAYGINDIPGSGGGSVLAAVSNPIVGTPTVIDRGAGGAGGYVNHAGQKGGDGYVIIIE